MIRFVAFRISTTFSLDSFDSLPTGFISSFCYWRFKFCYWFCNSFWFCHLLGNFQQTESAKLFLQKLIFLSCFCKISLNYVLFLNFHKICYLLMVVLFFLLHSYMKWENAIYIYVLLFFMHCQYVSHTIVV